MPMSLEEFIEECRQTVADRQSREEVDKAERDRQFEELRQSVLASLRSRVGAAIPQPLRAHASHAGKRPTLEQLQGYPDKWTPSEFEIEAPGLTLIKFLTAADGPSGPLRVTEIIVDGKRFGADWVEAVAAAAVTPVLGSKENADIS